MTEANGRVVGLLVLALCLVAGPGHAAVRTVCGVRSGTAGNAFLDAPGGRPVIELARQGGSQRLLDEADVAVGPQPRGETGTQTGVWYCLRVRFGPDGMPLRVLRGRRSGPG